MLKDFRAFITRGNVVDLAVGIVIGVAFGAIINSFVKDVIMPPIGLALGSVDFTNLFAVLKEGTVAGPYASLTAAQEAGAVSINYSVFIFFFVVRPIAQMHARQKAKEAAPEPNTKECPFCYSNISIKANRCPNCTSELKAV
jgi:large conductance mechanosensitive channel